MSDCYRCGQPGHNRNQCLNGTTLPGRVVASDAPEPRYAGSYDEHMARIKDAVRRWHEGEISLDDKRRMISDENIRWHGVTAARARKLTWPALRRFVVDTRHNDQCATASPQDDEGQARDHVPDLPRADPCREPDRLHRLLGARRLRCAADHRPPRRRSMSTLARCLFRGCPMRFLVGEDRFCVDHRGEDLGIERAAAELGIDLGQLASMAPGDRGALDGAPR